MHELDFTKGKAAIAFAGDTPWHGYGENILPEDSVDDIRIKAGLDYDVVKTPVQYTRPLPSMIGDIGHFEQLETSTNSCVLYRSDTGADLSVVSPRYQVVQPKDVVEFYRDLTEQFGFKLDVVGALKGGRKVWALANTNEAFQLRDRDDVKGYLLLATSYDGTMSTQARFTSVRVVCNNTLSVAVNGGRAEVTVPHSTAFNADAVKRQLQIGSAWETFSRQAKAMSERIVNKDETVRFLLDVYFGLASTDEIRAFQDDEKNAKTAEKFMARMTTALFEAPGAQLASARGTLWGVLNAVTRDQDYQRPARSGDNRLNAAWFGDGEAIKNKAWSKALAMVA